MESGPPGQATSANMATTDLLEAFSLRRPGPEYTPSCLTGTCRASPGRPSVQGHIRCIVTVNGTGRRPNPVFHALLQRGGAPAAAGDGPVAARPFDALHSATSACTSRRRPAARGRRARARGCGRGGEEEEE